MTVTVTRNTSWQAVLNNARATMKKSSITKNPDKKWKHRMLFCEHSPIRALQYTIVIEGIPSWVSVHFTRHKIGVEHFVSTQRTDRTGVNRDKLKQSELVNHTIYANAQAIISMSRKRLCRNASQETRDIWYNVLAELYKIDRPLAHVCVPECVYRGFCYEFMPCGFYKTPTYTEWLTNYRALLKGVRND